MRVIICPGIHASELTDSFVCSVATTANCNHLRSITLNSGAEKPKNQVNQINIPTNRDLQWLVLPTRKYLPYDPVGIYHWLNQPEMLAEELLFIAFSAGVVGGIGAAIALQQQGVKIKAFIAIDGWGVPLWGDFPVYRFSHDYFTHWSSAILGTGQASFYADPPVAHLTIWRSPETCQGWIVTNSTANKIRCSARDYLQQIVVSG